MSAWPSPQNSKHCPLFLPAEVRHPERVDHVLRRELELDLLTDRDIQLFAGLEQRPVGKLEHRLVGIREAPGPLTALDLHGHRHIRVHVVDEVEALPRERRERDHHERRYDRPDELERVLPVYLPRHVSRPLAELDARVSEGTDDDREHDGRAREEDPVEDADRFGQRPAWVERPGTHREED